MCGTRSSVHNSGVRFAGGELRPLLIYATRWDMKSVYRRGMEGRRMGEGVTSEDIVVI